MSADPRKTSSASAPERKQRFTVVELTTLALLAGLLIAAKAFFRIPIKVPGHTGIFWMAVLVIGKAVVRKPTAGTLIGLVSGILAVAIVPSQEGVFVAVKYIAAGVAIDAVTPLVGGNLGRWIPAALVGAASNAAKLVSDLLVSFALGLPIGFIVVGLAYGVATHVVFGAMGGWVGSVVFGRLRRANIPQLRGTVPEPGEE
jgi:hypothetical protein